MAFFYIAVAGIAVLVAPFIWFIGGWFYNERITWCGLQDFDRRKGRLIYTFSTLIIDIPLTIFFVGLLVQLQSGSDNNWHLDISEYIVLVKFVFVLWSIAASYTGVTINFALAKWKTRLWFIAVPMAFYGLTLGVLSKISSVFS